MLGKDLLHISLKAANLLVDEFTDASPNLTPGHPEIELALIRLYRHTREPAYLSLARQFIRNRGRALFPGLQLTLQAVSMLKRSQKASAKYLMSSSQKQEFENLKRLQPGLQSTLDLRTLHSFLSGRYHQQHLPTREMSEPVGHAVRWSYLSCAAAMAAKETHDDSWLEHLDQSWTHMVKRKMYVTGGLGSISGIEGFGDDYQLHNHSAYCETCASLASIFWSFEMLGATGKAAYADLIEWQLHNAVAVCVGSDGQSYFYNNHLESNGEDSRNTWFSTACCPRKEMDR